jgi:hypothetical protein
MKRICGKAVVLLSSLLERWHLFLTPVYFRKLERKEKKLERQND